MLLPRDAAEPEGTERELGAMLAALSATPEAPGKRGAVAVAVAAPTGEVTLPPAAAPPAANTAGKCSHEGTRGTPERPAIAAASISNECSVLSACTAANASRRTAPSQEHIKTRRAPSIRGTSNDSAATAAAASLAAVSAISLVELARHEGSSSALSLPAAAGTQQPDSCCC